MASTPICGQMPRGRGHGACDIHRAEVRAEKGRQRRHGDAARGGSPVPEFGENQHNGLVWVMLRRAHVETWWRFATPRRSARRRLMVCRVAALEGGALESSDPTVLDATVPREHAWVVCDNDDARGARDSRTFGPLDLRRVVGRVVYVVRSATDHGRVHNSREARWVDDPVVRVELDAEQLAADLAESAAGRRR